MRAFASPDYGVPPTLHDIAVPEPGAGELRVRVHAASINGFDQAVAGGYLKGMMEHRFPVVLGKDFAGTVDALGDGVTEFGVGDRVFGVVMKPFLGDGSLGEYVTVPVAVGVATLPDAIGFVDASALGLAGAAAIAAVEAVQITSNQLVLIVGATGGVGGETVQLATHAGAHVIATAHTEAEREHVQAMGAAEVVDYAGDIAANVLAAHPGGVDTVVHLAGDPAVLLAAIKRGGRLVSSMVGSPEQIPAENVTVVAIRADPTPAVLGQLATNQEQGTSRVVIQRTYSLDQTADALDDFGNGTLGKLVVVIA
jgi:NADPH2:quinone reductase